jgi:radical SAM protein with 4Fe4S-binding SPASM domain
MDITSKIKQIFAKTRKDYRNDIVKKGIYRYNKDGKIVQLKVEDSGSGMLLVDGTRIECLNSTACEFMKMNLDGLEDTEAIKRITKSFKIKREDAERDYKNFIKEMQKFIDGEDDVEMKSIKYKEDFSDLQSYTFNSPLRFDFALTYRCNNKCAHCYIPHDRFSNDGKKPLTLEEWKRAIDATYDIGVTHICFTGGEPTLFEYLPELISYARGKNLLTGLITNGRALSKKSYVSKLVESGLDHVQITLESHIPEVHDKMVCVDGAWKETVEGIRNCVGNLHTITNTTLTKLNAPTFEDTLVFLKSLGIRTFASNSLIHSGKGIDNDLGINESELEPILKRILKKSNELSLNFLWYTPTRYCVLDPVNLGLGVKQCSAANVNMCIEPDGGVLPCQSFYQPLGNILTDDFAKIWNHDRCKWIREREYALEKCKTCEKFELCGCGCPLYLIKC